MKSLTGLLLLAVICGAYASPAYLEQTSLVRQKRQADGFLTNTRQLVEELIANLNKAAQEAKDAVKTFGDGLRAEVKRSQQRLENSLNELRKRIENAIKSLGEAASACVTAQQEEAEQMFSEALQKATACSEDRLSEAGELLNKLSDNADKLRTFASQAFEELRNCTEQQSNIFTAGACLGNVALQSELKGAGLLAQSGLLIGRLNLLLTTLPASLEFCAGTGLVNAGIGTARIVLKIGRCTANSGISALVDGANATPVTEIGPKIIENLSSSLAAESLNSVDKAGSLKPISIIDNNNLNIDNIGGPLETPVNSLFKLFSQK
ncbi:uncharacterized protein LOC113231853 [Hyposmocoma kahamanoa]|uniref:uncharacterized protein LOC113231853 n=1 Tax=Hyposmocoma kahamanoa TaxID=1477025 RepID=UPI000E6D67A1|nr:uncharacterized protein LOC113231853 [Hyposmocoma kahamanoa]